ncbi:MAG: hypothetical protein AB1742_13675 [bacterium]
MKKRAYLTSLAAIVLIAAARADAGIISTVAIRNFQLFHPGFMNRSENPFDLSRPLSLLDAKEKIVRFSAVSEDVYRLEKDGVLRANVNARGRKAFALLFTDGNEKNRAALGFDRSDSKIDFHSSQGVEATDLGFDSAGSAVSIARRLGDFRFGAYRNASSISGGGVSREMTDKLNLLGPGARLSLSLKEERQGWAVGVALAEKYVVSYQANHFRAPAAATIEDAADVYSFPAEDTGSSYEVAAAVTGAKLRKAAVYYRRGGGTGYDDTRYHVSSPADPPLFQNRLRNAFKSYGAGFVRAVSKRSTLTLEIEKYNGSFSGAGIVEALNTLSGLYGNYYNYHHYGSLNFTRYDAHYVREGGRWGFAAAYMLMPFDADLYFDGCDKILGQCTKSLVVRNYRFRGSKLHALSLGVRLKLGRGKTLSYAVSQLVPQVEREAEAPPAAPPPAPPSPPEEKKETGGRTHLVSLEFHF